MKSFLTPKLKLCILFLVLNIFCATTKVKSEEWVNGCQLNSTFRAARNDYLRQTVQNELIQATNTTGMGMVKNVGYSNLRNYVLKYTNDSSMLHFISYGGLLNMNWRDDTPTLLLRDYFIGQIVQYYITPQHNRLYHNATSTGYSFGAFRPRRHRHYAGYLPDEQNPLPGCNISFYHRVNFSLECAPLLAVDFIPKNDFHYSLWCATLEATVDEYFFSIYDFYYVNSKVVNASKDENNATLVDVKMQIHFANAFDFDWDDSINKAVRNMTHIQFTYNSTTVALQEPLIHNCTSFYNESEQSGNACNFLASTKSESEEPTSNEQTTITTLLTIIYKKVMTTTGYVTNSTPSTTTSTVIPDASTTLATTQSTTQSSRASESFSRSTSTSLQPNSTVFVTDTSRLSTTITNGATTGMTRNQSPETSATTPTTNLSTNLSSIAGTSNETTSWPDLTSTNRLSSLPASLNSTSTSGLSNGTFNLTKSVNGSTTGARTTPFDDDPFFRAVVPVVTKVYNDPALIRPLAGTMAPLLGKKELLLITIPSTVAFILAVCLCLCCIQVDWIVLLQPKPKKQP